MIAGLLLASTLAFGQATPITERPADLDRIVHDVRGEPLVARIEAISAWARGRPYLESPIGEGEGVDADPPARYDGFDCMTFVEEVMALALAPDDASVDGVRQALRYGDRSMSYANRRHFVELQWLPEALASGRIVPTSADYGPTVTLRRTVTEATWQAWPHRKDYALTDEELPTGEMSLEVLPIDAALAAYDRIRPGTILMVVREDRSWVPIWVTHMGWVVSGARPTLRHASQLSSARRVIDHDLGWYLGYLKTYRTWPVVGVALFEPREPTPPSP